MLQQMVNMFLEPLENFLKSDLNDLKEKKKRFERSFEAFEHADSKYMSKKSKDMGIFESAQEVAECRKEFHSASLAYCLKLNEIHFKKKAFFAESVIPIYSQWFKFLFHAVNLTCFYNFWIL